MIIPKTIRLLFLCTILASTAYADDDNDLLLILDASNSMWGQIDGVNKIIIARESLGELIDEMPNDSQVGLIAYGHRREGDCEDIEVLQQIEPINKEQLKTTVNAINPKGKTPLTASINTAVDLVRERDGTSIVLISDGLETCDLDPCAAVKTARESGAPFVLHVVGFDINEDEAAQLECVAQAGGGLYLSADNPEQLSAALAAAYEKPEIPDGRLSVQVTAEGALQDSVVRVRNAETGEDVAAGRTYTAVETNPRIILLDDGSYSATVDAVGIKGTPRYSFDFSIVDGDLVEKTFDFSPGELSVHVTRNGELSDAVVTVNVAGTTDRVTGGRTYTSDNHNPMVLTLSAGRYDVLIRSVEISKAEELSRQGIDVVPGERTELSFEYASGDLLLGSHRSGELVDTVVRVNDSEGKSVAGGRTYTSDKSNPKSFTLAPGEYTVSFSEVRGERSSYETSITVNASETSNINIDLDTVNSQ